MDDEGRRPSWVAAQLGVSVEYVYMLRRTHAPGAKLRLQIEKLSNGAVGFADW